MTAGNRPPWPPPMHLTLGGPTGPKADPHLGLRRYVVRDALEIGEDPFGLGSPAGDDGDPIEDLMLRFYGWLRRQPFSAGKQEGMVRRVDDFLGYLDDNMLGPEACTEFDLRMYLYDWTPRRPRRKLFRPSVELEAASRLFEYLEQREGLSYPWAASLLADDEGLHRRWESYPNLELYHPRMIAWRRELYDDLNARGFIPDTGIAGGGEWLQEGIVPVDEQGEDELTLSLLLELHDELSRRWLVWREEVIASGLTQPGPVRAVLVRRQREWETRPHPGLAGETPSQAIRRARTIE